VSPRRQYVPQPDRQAMLTRFLDRDGAWKFLTAQMAVRLTFQWLTSTAAPTHASYRAMLEGLRYEQIIELEVEEIERERRGAIDADAVARAA